ncbi:MAG TPA: 50S ribosomal protein L25 [Candidatus Omnitrophica bacterium]|nr:MAG: hypothetical protein A2Z81_04940 [Omnitrophica WOR_2 bacterium GWA2_45_18]HBR14877.1 50S ribosomal protein L25 [Candidatus Omnitrophota bacterium]
MEEIKLDVQLRNQLGSRKIKSIRREGFIPAIVYGADGGPTPIKVEQRNYKKIMRLHKGQFVVFHLNVLEGSRKLKDYSVILKEEQLDPVSEELVHIDFHQISLTEKIEVKVPVATKGDPIGVKQGGGTLEHGLWELDVVCLPTNIPEKIEIDVSHLNIGQVIHVKDVILPEGVSTRHDPESLVVSVVYSMKEKETEEAVTEAPNEPEVIKAKKETKETKEVKEAVEAKPKEK